MVGFGKHAEIV